MANMAVKLVSQFFESKGIKPTELGDDLLRIGFNFEGGTIEIFFQFDETDTHVHLRGMNFIKVPTNKYDVMYKILNECNAKYNYVKFVLNIKDGQINVRDDDVIQLDSCGLECFELMLRMVTIVEEVYPEFMKVMWA